MKRLSLLLAFLLLSLTLMISACDDSEETFQSNDDDDDVTDDDDDDDDTCTEGDTKTAEDGCNTCSCIDGEWSCTEMACEDLNACLAACGEGCPAPDSWICAENGQRYCNQCILDCYGLSAADDESLCDEAACTNGETKPAEDGCNTCTCEDGSWSCTEMDCDELESCLENCGDGCIPPGGLLCASDGNLYCGTCELACYGVTEAERSHCEVQAGTTCNAQDGERFSDDGCNTCSCQDGTWSCTEIACSSAQNLSFSECLETDAMEDSTTPVLEASYDSATGLVHVSHLNATLNCCLSDLDLDMDIDGFVINFAYLERFDEAGPCDCVCPTNVSFDLANLATGTYTLQYGTGAIMLSTTVTVGDAPAQGSATLNTLSGCLNDLKIDTPTSSEPEESLQARFDAGTATVIVNHRNAELNCCVESINPRLTQEGFTLRLGYEEHFDDNGPCDCVCPNNVETHLQNLSAGTYTLYAGSVFTTFTVVEEQSQGAISLDTLSGCLNDDRPDKDDAEPVESLQARFDATSGDVIVTHRNASLNCCLSDVLPHLSQDGFTLSLSYEEIYDGSGPCYCMCPNDVETRIHNLARGHYTLRAGGVSTTVEIP